MLYIRIRRLNRTIFFNVNANESISHVLERLAYITLVEPSRMKLFYRSSPIDNVQMTVADCGIVNDDLLVLVYAEPMEDGSFRWENPEETSLND
ncbi:hypothetical protein RCL1_005918 [Eukaryota sp. TZLM3-RCL]